MQFARPDRVEDALALLSTGEWGILAGGTDFYPGLRDGVATGQILDITAIDELRAIRSDSDHISIGALATWSDVIAADLPPSFDALKLAAREVGSVQIQNRATVAGNICNASPAADGVPPLLALDASVELMSAHGPRQLPLQQFILGNRRTALRDGELVTRLLIPKTATEGVSAFLKLGARKYLVISISMVAARLATDEAGKIASAAVSVGSCSEVAQRLPDLEAALIGAGPSEDLTERVKPEHLSSLSPIDDVRAPAAYRIDASEELIRRTIANVAERMQ